MIAESSALSFGPYRLVGPQGPLWHDTRELKLPPKALAVLWQLANQAGEVVTKTALLKAVWPQTVVGEDALAFQIQTLRQVFGDDAKQPRYIATLPRVGYSFVAPVTTTQSGVKGQGSEFREDREGTSAPDRDTDHTRLQTSSPPLITDNRQPAISFIGREGELTQLHQLYAKAMRGERQMVFVTGEAGIGKTALVETFLAQVNEAGGWRLEASPPSSPQVSHLQSQVSPLLIARGQCIEHYGAGEAYMPVLDALGRLCRHSTGAHIIEVLRRVAPSWLAQLPGVLNAAEHAALQMRVAGTPRERMLREIAEALELLTERGAMHASPLLLMLEDLHWSDVSTIELLSTLARRREAARLLVLGTYRSAEMVIANHPLRSVKQDLVTRGQGVEISLGNLNAAHVRTYVTRRFPDIIDESRVSAFVYRRTDGHPLFMVQVADHLAQPGVQRTLEAEISRGLQDLLELQMERLPAAQRHVLEVASVAGAEFTAASVAAGGEIPVEVVEERCEGLARQGQFIEERGLTTWPDGTVSGRYGFRHALYEEVLYRSLGAGRRAQLHLRIGTREEAGYGERSREIASQLAVHFECAQDIARAVRCRQQAAETALGRNAHQEAIGHLQTGLTLLQTVPDTPVRAQQELALQSLLGTIIIMNKGWGAPDVVAAYARARVLCEQSGNALQLFPMLWGWFSIHIARAELRAARELGEEMLRLAERLHDRELRIKAHEALGLATWMMGDLATSRQHHEQALVLCDPQQPCSSVFLSSSGDSSVSCCGRLAIVLGSMGFVEQGRQQSQAALTRAQALGHYLSLADALLNTTVMYYILRDAPATQAHAERTIAISQEWGFAIYPALATALRGWALAAQGEVAGGIGQIQDGLILWRGTEMEICRQSGLAALAEAYRKDGQVAEGLQVVAEALTALEKSGERWCEADLHRVKGELMLPKLSVISGQLAVQKKQKSKAQDPKSKVNNPQSAIHNPQLAAEAEACFLKAIEVARQQEAKLFELRAAVSLVRLWQQQGKKKEAHQMLAEVYSWFAEGFDTVDLQEARALLGQLAG